MKAVQSRQSPKFNNDFEYSNSLFIDKFYLIGELY